MNPDHSFLGSFFETLKTATMDDEIPQFLLGSPDSFLDEITPEGSGLVIATSTATSPALTLSVLISKSGSKIEWITLRTTPSIISDSNNSPLNGGITLPLASAEYVELHPSSLKIIHPPAPASKMSKKTEILKTWWRDWPYYCNKTKSTKFDLPQLCPRNFVGKAFTESSFDVDLLFF
ncbi:hypothetical protein O181_079120 [Austropuccinia psidii MF-1]|uniref:Uncharacterized protein n=1 Tax=Austropuccinia psidii MF-1 TaxID=1389203 RepID=A0A9Q3FKU2_9BASI|nr:hypothetical protein [Austropuccinia psidii MF-1]